MLTQRLSSAKEFKTVSQALISLKAHYLQVSTTILVTSPLKLIKKFYDFNQIVKSNTKSLSRVWGAMGARAGTKMRFSFKRKRKEC